MTTRREGTGSATYQPPSARGAIADVFQQSNPAAIAPIQPGRYAARYGVEMVGPDVARWWVEIRDLRGGLNLQRGNFNETHDRLASSTLDSRFPNTLVLPLLAETDASPDPTGFLHVASADAFGSFAIGMGGGANVSLMIETSATDPTPAARTFTPNGAIRALVRVILNTSTEYLVVLGNGDSEWLTDLGSTPTSAGDNNNLSNSYGAVVTSIGTVLVNDVTAIKSILKSDVFGATPTTTLTRVSRGGYALGLLSLGGGPLRAYWVWPRNDLGSVDTMIKFGAEKLGDIYHINQNGADPQKLSLPLKGVLFAALWRDGIVATDGERIVFTNGRVVRDLFWNSDRTPNSDMQLRCRGFYVNGAELAVEVNLTIATNGVGATTRWIETYDFDLGAWHQIGAVTTYGSTGLYGVGAGGSLPVSPYTGFGHIYADGAWRQHRFAPYGQSTYTLRKTAGATAATGVAYATTGTATTPKFQIPGIEGWALMVKRIVGPPQENIDAAGIAADATTVGSISIAAADQSGSFAAALTATFSGNRPKWRRPFQNFESNRTIVSELQFQVTATQQVGGTDPTRGSPTCLPFRCEGYAFRPRGDLADMPLPSRPGEI